MAIIRRTCRQSLWVLRGEMKASRLFRGRPWRGPIHREAPMFAGNAGPDSRRYRSSPDPERGPVAATADGGQRLGKTLTKPNNFYKTSVLEERILREQQGLASAPSAEPGPGTQHSPNRPAKRGSSAMAGRKTSKREHCQEGTHVACGVWPVGITRADEPSPLPPTYCFLLSVSVPHDRLTI